MNILYVVFSQTDTDSANMLCTSMRSFRKVNTEAKVILYYADLDYAAYRYLKDSLYIDCRLFDSDEWDRRRMLCKLEKLDSILNEYSDGNRVLMADADVFYCKDPFTAYDEYPITHMAFCERTNFLRFPVNGGIVYFVVNDIIRGLLRWWRRQIANCTWEPLKKVAIFRKWPDFFCDQDMLCAIHDDLENWNKNHSWNVVILSPKYNFFPEVDAEPDWKNVLKNAYQSTSNNTLHFKGDDLKTLVKESWFKDYVRILE